MKLPKVSVCIPVYNPGSFLADAIDSVLAQSFADFELVVVDDASTQPIETTITGYSDPRLRLEKNPRNQGLVGNWNRCLTLAQGEYITLFHQDDVMRPANLATKTAMLDANPEVGLVHSNIETIDAADVIIGGHWAAQPSDALVTPGHECFKQLALRGNFIACPSVMVRSVCYKNLGGFDARLPFSCDLEMWMRIAGRYDVGYLVAQLVAVRMHPGQETQRFSGAGREIHEVRRALDIAFAEHAPAEASAALRHTARRNLATWACRMGRWKLGRRHWRAALGYFWAGGEALLSTWSR